MFFKNLNRIVKNLDRELDRLEEGEVTHVHLDYVDGLEEELRNRGFEVELDHLRLEDGEQFRVLIYPSREDFIRARIVYGYLDLKDYISSSDYSKLIEEYNQSEERDLGLRKWLVRKGKVRDAESVIPPEDYVFTVFRSFRQECFYDVKRGWYSNGFA